jgi:hypothetical protein
MEQAHPGLALHELKRRGAREARLLAIEVLEVLRREGARQPPALRPNVADADDPVGSR